MGWIYEKSAHGLPFGGDWVNVPSVNGVSDLDLFQFKACTEVHRRSSASHRDIALPPLGMEWVFGIYEGSRTDILRRMHSDSEGWQDFHAL